MAKTRWSELHGLSRRQSRGDRRKKKRTCGRVTRMSGCKKASSAFRTTGPLLARESWEFVRFVNPGDLRVAAKTCGSRGCHEVESKNVARSMMTHGAMLWGAALYNNGGFPIKDARFGESYSENGAPQSLIQVAAANA